MVSTLDSGARGPVRALAGKVRYIIGQDTLNPGV